jgi:excisionase family DNA binding protein
VNQSPISDELRGFVQRRAQNRCEYCRLPVDASFYAFEVDHVIARKHGGETLPNNLAFACWRCNRHKGTDIASFDPQTGALTALFHPRAQQWSEHFQLSVAELLGRTPEGRTTVKLLQLNTMKRIAERRALMNVGAYPELFYMTSDSQKGAQEPVDPLTVGELISLQEAAEYAGLTRGSLKDYIKRGRLKAKKIGTFWVTTRAAIDEYMSSRNLDNIPKKYRDRS